MTDKFKTGIIGGLAGGLFFAMAMAAFDYFNNTNFNTFKFIFHFVFFGLFQTLFFGINFKKNKG